MTTATLANRFVMGNDVAELRRMTRWLRQSAAAAGVAQDVVHVLDQCANEAVVNIISYAFDDGARHDIALELKPTEKGISLEIRDEGKPFNMLQAPERKPASKLADAEIGGLGVHLIRHLIDRCDYRREGGVNVLLLEAQHTRQPSNA